MLLFAQISEKATDPAAWKSLVETIGVGGFFGLVIVLLFALGMWYVLRATLGKEGFLRAIAEDLHQRFVGFLSKLETGVDAQRETGAAMRDAGRHFAAGMVAIGDALHVDVRDHAAAIEVSLSRAQSPIT
jgi:hypothetical protein